MEKTFSKYFMTLVLSIFIAGCGNWDGNSANVNTSGATLTAIAVTPADPNIAKNLTIQLQATGIYSDGTSQDITTAVTWSEETPEVATVNAEGLATGIAAGTSVVQAALGDISGNTTLTVTAATLSLIRVTPVNPTIPKGLPKSFTATGIYSDGIERDMTDSVVWSSGTIAVANVIAGGLATGVTEGQSVITATSGSISGSTTLTVTAATLSLITVTPVNPAVAKGLTKQFTATGIYSDGTAQDLSAAVVWSSGTTSVAIVDADGLAIGGAVGTSQITATSGSISGHTTLTVTAATLSLITVTPTNPSVAKGLTKQFAAIGTFTDGTSQDMTASVIWSSGTTSVAVVSASGGTGSGIATGVAAGTSLITATAGSISGNTTLTVTAAALSSIAVTPVNPSVANGLSKQFLATGTYTDGTSTDITTDVTWSSGTIGVATVSSVGLATGIAPGTSLITASWQSKTGSTTLTVTAATLSSIAVTPVNPSVVNGLSRQFLATGTYTDGTSTDITTVVTWSSGTIGVATVVSGGLATGMSAGTSVITATLDTIAGNTTLTVTAATLASITVTPVNPSVVAGLTRPFVATGTYTDGTSTDITTTVTWSSGTIAVATITSDGLATGLTTGTSLITATLGSVAGNTTLTVTAATLSLITVTPINPSLVAGLTRQFVATGTYSNGTSVDISALVIWSSGTIAVATVNPGGLATGVGTGTSLITATLGGKTGNTTLTVTAATLSSIAVTPVNPTVVNGLTRQFVAIGTYSNGISADISGLVTWSSGTIGVATVVSGGLATGMSAGNSVITATLDSIAGNTTLTVTAATLSSITVTPIDPTIANGLSQPFVATGTYTNGTSVDITSSVIWTSGTIDVAIIDADGLATGVGIGTSVMTATSGSISGNSLLTVTAATLVSIVVTPENPSIAIGQTVQFTATGIFSDGTSQDISNAVIWTSDTTTVATIIDASGLATAVAIGTSVITATSGSISATTLVATALAPGPLPVSLGSAATFALLAGSTITNAGPTVVHGNLGLSLGTSVTGFPPGEVLDGTIYTGADPVAVQAKIDLTDAYNDAVLRSGDAVILPVDISGQTLLPGLYKTDAALAISSGDLTLDAQGDANAVWVFQIGSTLTTSPGRQILLARGALPENIFWQVGSSATVGTLSIFAGNILAWTSITLGDGATVHGRALAINGAITLVSNIVTRP